MNKSKDGHFYVGCGKGGGYEVALSGDDLTWTHITVKADGSEFCDGIVSSIAADSNRNIWVGQCGKQYAKNNDATPGHGFFYGARSGSSWTFSWPCTPATFPDGKMYKPGDTIHATGPVFSLYGSSDLMSSGMFIVDVRVDPFDDNIIIFSGKSGSWMTRDGGASFYNASFGQNGMEVNNGLHTSGASAGSAGVADWTAMVTTDKWRSAKRSASVGSGVGKALNSSSPVNYGPSDGCLSGNTMQFTPASASAPAKLTINGVKVSDATFEGQICHPTYISDFADGTVVIGQFGGGITCVDPVANPATPGLS